MMDEPTLEEWMDRHHVEVVRTHATGLDGHAVGKYLRRSKFLKSLPKGHAIADMSLAGDYTGQPHLTIWHEMRSGQFGDILLKPDIDTIISDGTDGDLGHVICEFTSVDGDPLSLCPRTLLRRVTNEIGELGYDVKASFELEFFVYRDSFENARRKGYKNLTPLTASRGSNIYLLRNAHNVKPFMDEVLKRLSWQKFEWESWSDEGGVSQVEINFSPTDPVRASDLIVRARQIIYEVAVDLEMSVCFMPQMKAGFGSGLHIHHSLVEKDGTPAFFADGGRSALMNDWIAGIVTTMAGSVSLLCPTINSYRRMQEFRAPPVTATWGEENKSAGLRIISRAANLARIEHRLPGGDANPYLVLATILAGGLAGHRHQLPLRPELKTVGWGLPDDVPKLPRTLLSAADALAEDNHLVDILGQDFVEYWIDSRKFEWLTYHSECGDTENKGTTDWELQRYFELM
ncbi:MAG: hypothetical protein JJ934_14495 [Pseudomonadales bacterium]|nr:hypothetical protein [Pseudomonadales bacterium]MBO6566396.1 hypothetical protein [Pseudomonadales bacterium]MBO6658104.1 hypothetical protein [Pseudomonadales bacterium]